MKLSESKPYFESSGDLQEHFFSIKDQGMIFDILRSKMYSNPILAICREITCNARDAHREVGTPEVPVHIQLPAGLEPNWKVKDFGPGISPDRMLNIFIQYTASTKRDDNTQTGGFGLGAKTPFSYSDTFLVTTIHDGTRYSYSCTIDDTKVGKLLLLDKRPSDEPNSTEICIRVKPVDFNTFHQYTEQACRHWDTKPIVTGGSISWETTNKIAEGTGWAICSSHDYNKNAKVVIDGIEYPLTLDDLRKYADTKLIDAARGNFIAYKRVRESFRDIHSNTMDNSVGALVEVPRNQVDEDSSRTCSHGLHVANWTYAHTQFASSNPETDVMLEVEVNPADVVAIPADYNNAKMRVCKYKVLGVVTTPFDESKALRVVDPSYVPPSDFEDDVCADCECEVCECEDCDYCQENPCCCEEEEEETCIECGAVLEFGELDYCIDCEDEEEDEVEETDRYPYEDELDEEE